MKAVVNVVVSTTIEVDLDEGLSVEEKTEALKAISEGNWNVGHEDTLIDAPTSVSIEHDGTSYSRTV